VQARLVESGHVRVHPAPGQADCLADLLARERTARTVQRGLWSNAAYQIRPADRPAELARYAGTFQLLRGRVERVVRTQGLVILDLASAEPLRRSRSGTGSTGIRVLWRRHVAALPAANDTPALEGREVQVHGWISLRSGRPEIEILSSGQIAMWREAELATSGPDQGDAPTMKSNRPAAEPPGEKN
jgi:hypothetical protein